MKKYFYFPLLITTLSLLIFQGCQVERLDSDDEPTMKNCEICDIVIRGRVLDGKEVIQDANGFSQLAGIDGAFLCSEFFDLTTTDDEGNFRIDIRDRFTVSQLASEILIDVTKDGYINSTISINLNDYLDQGNCPDALTDVVLDFVLTPKQDEVRIGSNTPLEYIFTDEFSTGIVLNGVEETELLESQYIVEAPAGILATSQPICITPLHFDQFVGKFDLSSGFYGLPLKQFNFQPAGLELTLPISISFTPDYEVNDGDSFSFFAIDRSETCNQPDASEGIWTRVQDVPFSYDAANNLVTFMLDRFPSYGLITLDSNPLEIKINGVDVFNGLAQERIENCDCSDVILREFSYDFTPGSTICTPNAFINMLSLEQKITLSRVLRNYFNLPGPYTAFGIAELLASGNELRQCDDLSAFNSYSNEVQVCINKCEVLSVLAATTGYSFSGSFESAEFLLISNGAAVLSTKPGTCPTTTACHQGCPD
ncbi:MAG: hypothetical protein AAGG75_24060 [Bacteroidota bacterium]